MTPPSDDTRAHQRIDDHEKHCAERWAESRRAMDDLRADVRALRDTITDVAGRLYGRVWWIVGLLLAGEGAAIVWLASKAFP